MLAAGSGSDVLRVLSIIARLGVENDYILRLPRPQAGRTLRNQYNLQSLLNVHNCYFHITTEEKHIC
jgi:hypothetical protein